MTLSEPPLFDPVVASLLTTVRNTVAELWGAVVPESTTTPTVQWENAEDGSAYAVAQLVEVRPHGFGLLLLVRLELEKRGWTVGRQFADPRQLVAWGTVGQLFATYSETTSSILIELSSEPVRLDEGRLTSH